MKTNKLKSAAFNRRQMFLAGAIASGAGFVRPWSARAASTLPMRGSGPEIYSRFGVKPFINCTSTYTINGGSAMLPEVIEAMNDASYYQVNFDELMEGAGKRLAELLPIRRPQPSAGARQHPPIRTPGYRIDVLSMPGERAEASPAVNVPELHCPVVTPCC